MLPRASATSPAATKRGLLFSLAGAVARPLPHRARAMAAPSAARTIWVKGDPDTSTLGDCPFCHRALLTLELKGLPYEKEYINFSNKPEWLFKYSEKGTVPIMREGADKYVPDSGDICDFLEANFEPKIGASAPPDGVGEKLLPSFLAFLKADAGTDEATEKEAALVEQLKQIDDYLAGTRPYLAGDSMGGADTVLFPRLYHLSEALPHFKAWHIPVHLTNVLSYIDRVKQTEAFKKTDYGHDKIIQGWAAHDGVKSP